MIKSIQLFSYKELLNRIGTGLEKNPENWGKYQRGMKEEANR